MKTRFSLDEILTLPVSANRVTWHEGERPATVPPIMCADGTEISVQAGWGMYSLPETTTGPWTHVEVGPLRSEPTAELARHMQTPISGVYSFVPVAVVRDFIDLHGGEA